MIRLLSTVSRTGQARIDTWRSAFFRRRKIFSRRRREAPGVTASVAPGRPPGEARPFERRSWLFASATAVFHPAAAAGAAQDAWSWPAQMKNAQVFPKDFPATKLEAIMKGFTRSLVVRCVYCHVGEEGKPLSSYDFASDARPNKE